MTRQFRMYMPIGGLVLAASAGIALIWLTASCEVDRVEPSDTAMPAPADDITTTTTSTTTTTTSSGSSGPGSTITVSVAGNNVTINGFWDDGSSEVVQIDPNPVSVTQDITSTAHPGERHQVAFSNIGWFDSTITGFTLVVDGAHTITYP